MCLYCICVCVCQTPSFSVLSSLCAFFSHFSPSPFLVRWLSFFWCQWVQLWPLYPVRLICCPSNHPCFSLSLSLSSCSCLPRAHSALSLPAVSPIFVSFCLAGSCPSLQFHLFIFFATASCLLPLSAGLSASTLPSYPCTYGNTGIACKVIRSEGL